MDLMWNVRERKEPMMPQNFGLNRTEWRCHLLIWEGLKRNKISGGNQEFTRVHVKFEMFNKYPRRLESFLK